MELCRVLICGGLGPQTKSTPLHGAVEYGRNESVQLLLTAKADANAADSVNDLPSVLCWNRAAY